MATDNYVQIIGNVTRDPELRFTTSGAAVCSVRYCVDTASTQRQRRVGGRRNDVLQLLGLA